VISLHLVAQVLQALHALFQALPMAAKFENSLFVSPQTFDHMGSLVELDMRFVKLGLRMRSGSRRGIVMLVAEARAEVCVVIAAITERIFLSGEASLNGGLGVVEPRGRRRVVVVWESGGWRGGSNGVVG
jgi:hypothetical protein